eukprot:TRINITY_DN11060_c0_g1_i3.p1 TRINITY_DN11060_c0_g1~~TRINITY_DN11060_c0_g1_i3.p1  ORF type:complete len:610 (-),score=90.93 TRINITY_DN11060_c0_g1_i3:502-2331(-)
MLRSLVGSGMCIRDSCGSIGGSLPPPFSPLLKAAHLLAIGSRAPTAQSSSEPSCAALEPALVKDLVRNKGVPHHKLGSAHVLREQRHLLVGKEEAEANTQELTGMFLMEVPRFVFKAAATLTALNLSQNNLTSLPVEMAQLIALQILNVSCNELSSLPYQALASMTGLTELDCSQNQICGEFFNGFTGNHDNGMVSLARINASSNNISSVSGAVTVVCPVLNFFDLSGNDIEEFSSDTLAGMCCLTGLDLRRNPLRCRPWLGDERSSLSVLDSLPVEVCPGLRVGSSDVACNQSPTGITHILVLNDPEFDSKPDWWKDSPGFQTYLQDNCNPETLETWLPACLTWIRAALAHGMSHGMTRPLTTAPFYNDPMLRTQTSTHGDSLQTSKVLVYSAEDPMQAAAVAIAYMMAAHKTPLHVAANHVCEICSMFDSDAFMQSGLASQLRELEAQVSETEDQPVPGSPGGLAFEAGTEAASVLHCWRRHLDAAKVMPAKDPAGVNHSWNLTPATLLEPEPQHPTAPTVADVVKLMQFEQLCLTTIQVIAEQIEYNQQEFQKSGDELVWDRIATLKSRKAEALAHLDETFAHLATMTESMGCHAYYGGTIHSPWH